MIRITEAIPTQNYELVREQIAALLALEIENQIFLSAHPETVEIFEERSAPVGVDEDVVLSVSLDNISYQKMNQQNVSGNTSYNIDVYANAVATDEERGYLTAAKKVQKYAGMVRYILTSTKYNRLALPAKLIASTSLENIQMYEVPNNQDGAHNRMARINFSVKMCEDQQMWQGVALLSHITKVKLTENQGYQLKLEQ